MRVIVCYAEGFCFIPESITAALKLFEMESLLNLRDRVDRHLPLWLVVTRFELLVYSNGVY